MKRPRGDPNWQREGYADPDHASGWKKPRLSAFRHVDGNLTTTLERMLGGGHVVLEGEERLLLQTTFTGVGRELPQVALRWSLSDAVTLSEAHFMAPEKRLELEGESHGSRA